jgi:BASS family bile acid:Na+ symporter
MSLQQLVPLALQISIALIVFSVALQASIEDVTYLLRRPSLLVRSILAMSIATPILAAVIAAIFHLRPELEVALVLLAVSPVPPILPRKGSKAAGNSSYAIGLLAVSAVLAIVFAPLSVMLIARLFGHDVHVPAAAVAKVVVISVLGPLILGVIVRRLATRFAERVARPLSSIGMVLLVLAFIPLLAAMWRAITGVVGDHTLIAVAVFALVSLLIGHLLGGPAPEDRTVLALSTACRHPGVAITIAGAIAPGQRGSISAAVFLAVLVGAVVTAPYAKWRARRHAPKASLAKN